MLTGQKVKGLRPMGLRTKKGLWHNWLPKLLQLRPTKPQPPCLLAQAEERISAHAGLPLVCLFGGGSWCMQRRGPWCFLLVKQSTCCSAHTSRCWMLPLLSGWSKGSMKRLGVKAACRGLDIVSQAGTLEDILEETRSLGSTMAQLFPGSAALRKHCALKKH
eukprot:scaffold90224_cov17-Tisochrysis_lutea.AAC.1